MRLRKDPERSRTPARPPTSGSSPVPLSSVSSKLLPNQEPTGVFEEVSILRPIVGFWQSHPWAPVGLLVAATFFAYWPCLNGDFVWDDDAWTLGLQNVFQRPSGLVHIWTDLTALQQYYPLTATTFWLDYHCWGFWTVPYHVENVLLHILGMLLFWKLLNRLGVPGAPFAAGLAALHPLMVESAGWITERKNVLSLVLYIGALLCYGRFAGFWRTDSKNEDRALPGPWKDYGWALLLFLGAYLAKATAFSLPVVLLLIVWWKRGRLRWREDILPTAPFWFASVGLGLITSWLERTHVGARGPDWDLSFAERCLIAGRALWFYTGKLLWPADLCFIYPRWQLQVGALAQWLWPAAAAGVLVLLWLARRRIGRGPLTAVLFFAGTLFPLLGFFNGYFMRYSFVSDHWAYLSSLGLFALAAASLSIWAKRRGAPGLVYGLAAILLPLLWVQTWRHCSIFSDSETLYLRTLALNPNADLAHNNLGLLLAQAGEVEEALPHLIKAVEIRPGSAHAHNNLANTFRVAGRPRDAAGEYERALQLEPENANTWNNLALLLATSSDSGVRDGLRAVELAGRALALTRTNNPVVLATMAAALAEAGRFPEAIKTQQQALDVAAHRPRSGLAQALQAQLELYQTGLPFRESGLTPAPDPPQP